MSEQKIRIYEGISYEGAFAVDPPRDPHNGPFVLKSDYDDLLERLNSLSNINDLGGKK